MKKTAWSMFRMLPALAALVMAIPASAIWVSSATIPDTGKAAPAQALYLAPGSKAARLIELGEADAAAIAAVRKANTTQFLKRLQIGIGREVPAQAAAHSDALRWESVPGGLAAQWEIRSTGARALRVELDATNLPTSTQLRFAGSGDIGTVYGPFSPAEVLAAGSRYWSPVLEGERAIVEVFVTDAPSSKAVSLAIMRVSHLIVSAADPDAESLAKVGESQACEVDLICRSASDAALAAIGRSVARMTFTTDTGGTALCTGTLLNTTAGPVAPYFYSANHCFDTQATASTLTTHWFYDRTGCGSGTTSPSYVQVTGGATLLYGNATSDVLFLRLNQSPPAAAVYAGWDAAALGVGTAITAVHHPAGDWKKVSLGSSGGFSAYGGAAGDDHIIALWNSTATGVTEGGSSGSGIFTSSGGNYLFRGGLHGGPSSCSATGAALRDYYSRFDRAYALLASYLAGGTQCTYSLSPTSASVAAGGATGSFGVTTSSGCTWTATSNSSWITTSSSGSGSGTVAYSVAANTGVARTGSISVGGQTFTISQTAGGGGGTVSVIANGGFESNSSWVQSATSGAPIITSDASLAHSGSGVAWLGGYESGTDSIYQDVAIPAGATSVTLQYWYRITTNESMGSTIAYDTLAVVIQNPATGTTLATVASYSNVNATSGWVQSPAFNLTSFAGQTIRLRFTAMNDFSNRSSFFVDDVTLTAVTPGGSSLNYTALWWNPAESGWGINFSHQGNIVFGTLFTYTSTGQPLWLVMSNGAMQSNGVTFTGELYRTTGPPFNAVPFTPIGPGNITQVGTMSVTFTSVNTATLTYSFNGAGVTKSIERQVFGSRAANCAPTSGARESLTNYQDLWWNALESGWGVNITHQDNVLFATLFTYDSTGSGLWLVMSAGVRQPDGSYFGELYRTTGPPFNAVPFTPIGPANIIPVGTMRFTFANGTTGTMTYSVNGVVVTKSITRQVFSSPLPACS